MPTLYIQNQRGGINALIELFLLGIIGITSVSCGDSGDSGNLNLRHEEQLNKVIDSAFRVKTGIDLEENYQNWVEELFVYWIKHPSQFKDTAGNIPTGSKSASDKVSAIVANLDPLNINRYGDVVVVPDDNAVSFATMQAGEMIRLKIIYNENKLKFSHLTYRDLAKEFQRDFVAAKADRRSVFENDK